MVVGVLESQNPKCQDQFGQKFLEAQLAFASQIFSQILCMWGLARMHSRMRTIRCSSHLPGGVSAQGVCVCLGGVSAQGGGVCLPRGVSAWGCTPSPVDRILDTHL